MEILGLPACIHVVFETNLKGGHTLAHMPLYFLYKTLIHCLKEAPKLKNKTTKKKKKTQVHYQQTSMKLSQRLSQSQLTARDLAYFLFQSNTSGHTSI